MNVSLKVKIFDDKGTRVLQVSKSTLTIGSASHCDVVFDDPSVSPEHTRAWLEGGRIWVQDLGSPNGTALNEIRLPALKPMLVRDLDVLRLGESTSTLGLEAIVVRAPVVKPKVAETTAASSSAAAEAKSLSAPELEKRKDEAQRLARELADLKLHVQMARLEKAAAEEMSRQLENLKDEIKNVHDQKEKWDQSLQRMEAEKHKMRLEVEREVAEFKVKAMNEMKKATLSAGEMRVRELAADSRIVKDKYETQIKHLLEEKDAQIRKLREENEAQVEKLRAANEAQLARTREQHDALMAKIREQTDLQLREMQNEKSAQVRHTRDESEKEVRQLRDQLETQRKLFEKELAEFKSKALKEVQRATTEEAGQQIKPLHEELKKYQAACKKLEKDLADTRARLQSETSMHESTRQEMEKQLSDVRAKSFKELSAHMLTEAQKVEKWKQDQASAFEKSVHMLARQKMRTWTAQGLDPDAVHDWEADINYAFRKIILNENEPQPAKRSQAGSHTHEEYPPAHTRKEEKKANMSARKVLKRWRPFAFPALFAFLIGGGLWFIAPFFRQYASRTLSSQTPAPTGSQAAVRSAAIPAPPGPYNPKQSKRYRNSYTENVIFLENYVGAEQNVDFRRRWQTELNKIATTEWKLDSWSIAPIAVEEQNLIKDLSKIRDSIHTTDQEAAGVERMRARETKYLRDLEAIFKGRAGVERFLKFKRAFYQRNKAYLTRVN